MNSLLRGGPGEAVGGFAGLDERVDFKRFEVDDGDLGAAITGDIRLFAVGTDDDGLRGTGDGDGFGELHLFKVDEADAIAADEGKDEGFAVGSGGGAVAEIAEVDAFDDFQRCGVDDDQLGHGLVGGEDELVVVADGDALTDFGDRDDFDEFVFLEVKHGDGAGSDIGGVTAFAVVADDEHVGLILTGGDAAFHLEGFAINDGDGVFVFGGDIEVAGDGVDDGAVGTKASTKVDGVDDFLLGEVDDLDVLSVGAGFADAGVAEDGDKGEFAVFAGDDFVAGDTFFGNGDDFLVGLGVNKREGLIAFVGAKDEPFAEISGLGETEAQAKTGDDRESGGPTKEGG